MLFLLSLFIFIQNIESNVCDTTFSGQQDAGLVESDLLTEASGIAASQLNPGIFWIINDSDIKPRIFAVSESGKHLGEFILNGITIRDWEDIAVAAGPIANTPYIYIGEIGDNDGVFADKYIYRIPEPAVDTSSTSVIYSIDNAETIWVQYPDGNRDAESLMVDPITRDIFIISKRESSPWIYKVPYPQTVPEKNIAERLGNLNILFPVAADISPNGLEILVKNYHPLHTNENIYHFCRSQEQTIWEALQQTPAVLPYEPEIQGESVCWDSQGQNYYTVSEENDIFRNSVAAHLYLYKRREPTAANLKNSKPATAVLKQNYPNPFNPTTNIVYTLSHPGFYEIKLYDVKGRQIEVIDSGYKTLGTHEFEYNAVHLTSGVYYYQLHAQQNGNVGIVKKMLVLK